MLIRRYKFTIVGKKGQWSEFVNFKSLELVHHNFYIKNLYSKSHEQYGKYFLEKHHQFIVSIVNEDSSKNVVIAKKIRYTDALKILMNFSNKLHLPYNDIVRKDLNDYKLSNIL